MIRVLDNCSKKYDAVLDRMERRLMLNDNNPKQLIIEDVWDKLSGRFDRISERGTSARDGPITEEIAESAFTAFMKQHKGIGVNYKEQTDIIVSSIKEIRKAKNDVTVGNKVIRSGTVQ